MKKHVVLSLCLALAGCGEPGVDPMDDGGTVLPGTDGGMVLPGTDGGMVLPGTDGGAQIPTMLPVLGLGTHSTEWVEITPLASPTHLSTPRDIAVHPDDPSQIWVVNTDATTVTIIEDANTATPSPRIVSALETDPTSPGGGEHFLSRPAALAFGEGTGMMATAPEMDEITQESTPEDFMGPTLFLSDENFDAGWYSHMDMLHNSPNSVGIAWERDNVYWVFDGAHESLTRYDFAAPHEPGGHDHTDGIIQRFAEGLVSYVPDVSSHLDFDQATGLLYVADTGNNRIAVFDPSTATRGAPIGPNYDFEDPANHLYAMDGGTMTTLVDGSAHGMVRPSGLVLGNGMVFVTDNTTSRIYAFSTVNGALIDYLDLSAMVPAGGLQGIDLEPTGTLVFVNTIGNRAFRIGPHQH
jgi:DNA-binding beta-propeller fold protein YncE